MDDEGRPRFNSLVFRRASPAFAAFDVLRLADQVILGFFGREFPPSGQFGSLTGVLPRLLPDGVHDGEIVCLDDDGRPHFNRLLFRRDHPVFAVFDALWLVGEDLRSVPLTARKCRLAAVAPAGSSSVLAVQHVERQGISLFQAVSEADLEGIVGKWAEGRYMCDGHRTSWVKVKNPAYSQAVGRHELFDGRAGQAREGAAETAPVGAGVVTACGRPGRSGFALPRA